MRFFRNLSIRAKVIAVVLLIIGPELILAASSIYYLYRVNNNLMRIVEFDANKMRIAARVKSDLQEVRSVQKNLLIYTSHEDILAQIDRKSESSSILRSVLKEFEEFIEPLERPAFREMSLHIEQFFKIDAQIERIILDHLKGGTRDVSVRMSTIDLSTKRGHEAYQQISRLIDDFISKSAEDLNDQKKNSLTYFKSALMVMLALCAAGIGGGLFIGLAAARSISENLGSVVKVTDAIARGDLDTQIAVDSGDETGRLAASVAQMQTALIEAAKENAARDYVKSGLTRINAAMHGKFQLKDLCTKVITEMAAYLDAQVGAMFLANVNGPELVLELSGGYAYNDTTGMLPTRFNLGEGLIGQAALSKAPISVNEIPEDYIKVCSGLGDSCPACITVSPLIFEGRVNGVIELGFFQPPTNLQLECIDQILPAVAITIETVRGRQHLAESLAQAQVLTEELQQQQDELKAANEELEEQTRKLRQSDEKLRHQQEELETINRELEEKNAYLEKNKALIEQTNRELARTRREIEEKAALLAQTSRFKSEFMANMSHELRTPLNSILLLARMLGENIEGRLSEEQVQSAQIIYSSGNDLLALINEVLDLAKIEAGRMELQIEPIDLNKVTEDIGHQFGHMVKEKGLMLNMELDGAGPQKMRTDRKRLMQILRNLISNALKFTESGTISVRIGRPGPDAPLPAGLQKQASIAFAVQDTGIGIAPDKQPAVFEAFQQLDSGTTRKFAGTGLGLSISRELAHMMGGGIVLQSTLGIGSTFTLVLPDEWQPPEKQKPPTITDTKDATVPQHTGRISLAAESSPMTIEDDRNDIIESDTAILVIEDDLVFGKHLMDLCRRHGCKVLYAASGEMGLQMAETRLPKGIFLDIRLPGRDGWSVLAALKENPTTRHIPVHIVSVEDAAMDALERGAVGFLTKPVDRPDLERALGKLEDVFKRPMKELLVVEDDLHLRQSIIKLMGNTDLHSDEAGSATEAIRAIKAKRYDCMILDLGLPDMNGIDLLKLMEKEEDAALPPVIVYTGRELTREQEAELRRYSESIIIKGVCSEERLLDEASLFLHRTMDNMSEKARKLITDLHDCDVMFKGKKIVIVDDDMRSLFALSKLLEEKGVITLKAENGRKALALLESNADADLILMDMMMPVMDGYETMQRIRAQKRFERIPIIALTAKAMPQDRARCIEAGASDYLPKPVDMMRLFSMMRVWLYR